MRAFYTDGASKHNGKAGQQKAYICVTNEDGEAIVDKFIGNHTNIEAEGYALIACFEYIYTNSIKTAEVRTDSKFWADAITRSWKLKKPHLFPIRDRLYKGYNFLNTNGWKLNIVWIPREESKAGWHLENQYKTKAQQKRNTPPITPIVK